MKILITGGAGMVGSHLADILGTLGHEINILDNLENSSIKNLANLGNKYNFFNYDVSQQVPDQKFDIIYHLACHPRSVSFGDPWRDVDTNIKGIVNVLELAKKHDSLVVYSSNSGIYDTKTMPVTEDTPDLPTSPYDVDKLCAEEYCKIYKTLYGIRSVVFRFAAVYGPRQNLSYRWNPVITKFINDMMHKRDVIIYGDGTQTRDFIFVDDLVSALVKVLEASDAIGRTMILGTGIETSINKLVEVCESHIGKVSKIIYEEVKLGDIHRMCYPSPTAQKLLNWKPETTLSVGVAKVYAWMKSHMERYE